MIEIFQGKTVRIGEMAGDSVSPPSPRVELEVGGTVLVTQPVQESHLKLFLNCQYTLRYPAQLNVVFVIFHDFSREFSPILDLNDDKTLKQRSFQDICQKEFRKRILFKSPTDKKSADKTCQMLGGVLTSDFTSPTFGCQTFWAPFYFDVSEQKWMNESSEPVGLEWMKNFPQNQKERTCSVIRFDDKRSVCYESNSRNYIVSPHSHL